MYNVLNDEYFSFQFGKKKPIENKFIGFLSLSLFVFFFLYCFLLIFVCTTCRHFVPPFQFNFVSSFVPTGDEQEFACFQPEPFSNLEKKNFTYAMWNEIKFTSIFSFEGNRHLN